VSATLGQIGFSERSGYTAIGTVCNLAARLCAEAKDGQILISSRARAVEAIARLENLGNLELKGLRRPVAAFNVVQSAPARPRFAPIWQLSHGVRRTDLNTTRRSQGRSIGGRPVWCAALSGCR
jgi:class 3 adenylate cyclase